MAYFYLKMIVSRTSGSLKFFPQERQNNKLQDFEFFNKKPENQSESNQKTEKPSDLHKIPTKTIKKNQSQGFLMPQRINSSQDLNTSKRPIGFIFKDPGMKPFCDKVGSFDIIYNELPESRLKLLVNPKILKNDANGIDLIYKKIEKEYEFESEKMTRHLESRKKLMTATKNRQKTTEELQARTGLVKHKNNEKTNDFNATARTQSLAFPKTIKKGFAEDFIDTYGMLAAGRLKTGNSFLPKSARVPSCKVFTPFYLRN